MSARALTLADAVELLGPPPSPEERWQKGNECFNRAERALAGTGIATPPRVAKAVREARERVAAARLPDAVVHARELLSESLFDFVNEDDLDADSVLTYVLEENYDALFHAANELELLRELHRRLRRAQSRVTTKPKRNPEPRRRARSRERRRQRRTTRAAPSGDRDRPHPDVDHAGVTRGLA